MSLIEDRGAAPEPHKPTTFESLADPAFRILWLSGLFSFLAVQMQFAARGWLAEEITGTNKGLGGVYFGFGIAMLLCMPFGGVAADRFGKRLVLSVGQAAITLGAMAMAVAIATDVVAYWMIVAASVLQGASFALIGPARMAFSAELVGPERVSNAIVLSQLSMNGTRVFGPATAGVLIAVPLFGIAGVYFLSAALGLISLQQTFRLPQGMPSAGRPRRSPVAEMLDGVRYVSRRPDLRLVMGVSFIVVMMAFPYVSFLPRLANGEFDVGSGGYGVMNSFVAIGAVIISLVVATRIRGDRAWTWMLGTGLAFGGFVCALAIVPNYWWSLVVLLAIGAGSSGFQSINNTLLITASDREYHGRVQSLAMLSFSGFGIIALPLGVLADAIGLRPTFAIMGGVSLLAMAVFGARNRAVRPTGPSSRG